MAEQDFAGRTAIVTGAAAGIGEAVAAELAARGATVIAADMDAEGLERVVADIAAAGGTAHARVADVSEAPAMEALVKFAQDKGGALHLAVNNAGIGGPQVPLGEYPLDGWRQVMGVNLDGVFYGMRYQIPAMLAAGGGAIVNMSSILGEVGRSSAVPYVATKHALNGLTKGAALEYSEQGIRINAVSPGFIATPILTKNLPQDVIDGLGRLHPIGRIGTSEEVSALVCFLLSDRASFITGSVHMVDGGYIAQ